MIRKKRHGWLSAVVLVLFMAAGCGGGSRATIPTEPETALAADFAPYQEVKVEVTPQVPAYKVATNLENVTNRERFKFSSEAQKLLVDNGFVVIPAQNPEFFMVYETNRYDGVPNFITTDAMLHNYHLFFNQLLKTVETQYFIPELKKLNTGMLAESQKQYESLKGTAWENAARRNVAFFTVGSRLLDPQAKIPEQVKEEVERELALIEAHQETVVSPVMTMGKSPDVLESLKEDYTQYIPRGHYVKSEELKNYFKTMMWYGRLTFRLKDQDEIRSAVLMTLALNRGENLKNWENIYSTTAFFVGKSDDLGYLDFQPVLAEVYGKAVSLKQLATDSSKWELFIRKAAKLRPPAINSVPIFDETIQPDREREIKGFRFMGQRFTLDASVFQRLVYREVKENPEGQRRLLPKGLDIPAAMGSGEAYAILKEMAETGYQNYPENMAKMREYIKGLDKSTWTQNLYWSWLYSLKPLIQEKPEGYPTFMRNQAWVRKELNTYLGSWTELKHDTILYAKQVYAEMGGGWEEGDDRGYVEPNPEVYARLAALTAMTREGLQSRGLLAERDKDSLNRLEKLSLDLKDIAVRELNNEPLSEADYELIRTFGGQLEHFWLEALRDDVQSRSQIWENPAPVVADVATAPPDLVLEVGTGYISDIYVVVPVEGKLRIARGGVYSYYEFPWPAADRLTDQKWQAMLRSGKAPEPPKWTGIFTARMEESPVVPVWQ